MSVTVPLSYNDAAEIIFNGRPLATTTGYDLCLTGTDTVEMTFSYPYPDHESTLHDLMQEGLMLADRCIRKGEYKLFERVSSLVERMILLAPKVNKLCLQ